MIPPTPPIAPDAFYFVTLYARAHQPLFARPEAKRLLLAHMLATKQQFHLAIAAYALLDDHCHWLFATPQGHECPAIVNHLRAGTQRDWRRLEPEQAERQIWESGLSCQRVAGRDALRECVDFIHYDPVQHGVSPRAADYPWSSFPTRVAEGHFRDDWAVLAPPAAVTRGMQPHLVPHG